jgi:dihydrofolate reductase
MIVAMSANGVIGLNGKIPWHIKEDLSFFQLQTIASTVIMGRKTFESIGKPLIHRDNIIISSTLEPSSEYMVARTSEEALEIAKRFEPSSIWICGGASIYRDFLDIVDDIYITRVDCIVHDEDLSKLTKFPEDRLDYSRFYQSDLGSFYDEENGYHYKRFKYTRI